MSKLRKIALSEFGETVTGKTPSSAFPEDFGKDYMFVTPSDNLDNKYVSSTERYLSEKGINKLASKILPNKSVLVSCIGSAMGKVVMNRDTCITNQQINSIKINKEVFDADYVYYALKSNYNKLRTAATGSTAVPLLNKTDFDAIEITIHKEKSEQKKIASVLSALDDKIVLNNKINAELEAMAKTIYDYWFVQFDFPAEASAKAGGKSIAGKPYKSSGGKMVYNEVLKREIPEGWEVKSLLEIADFTNGLACQKFRPIEESKALPVIKIKEMNEGISANTELVRNDIPEKVVINNGDVLFSWSASLDVKIWTQGKGGLNQHIFKVTSNKYPRTFYYYEVLAYLQHFKMIAELRKTTMGHITQDHLKQSRISVPPDELIEKIHEQINPLIELTIKNKEQNQQLSQLRDWLLPMLMNGQVTVGQAYEQVEEVLSMAAEDGV